IFFLGYLRFSGYSTNGRELFWLAYLLFISIVEEFAFRLLLPNFLMIMVGVIPATLLSNLAFAGVHFFTLRWRLINCVGAFLGGLGLSRLLGNTEDIILVVGVHWLVTFLNTPTAPTKQAVQ
ncbi:MAG: CPBP family intramembrane metalloprotease, partial [Porticoccaceae bacterium]|nr:CPBP family intramembrane metalloprotease [Porticoccaceae bacterium]